MQKRIAPLLFGRKDLLSHLAKADWGAHNKLG